MTQAPRVDPIVDVLAVPGAQLYTETRGAGPLLVFVVGGNGDAEVFSQVAAVLAARYTVVSYDRRGFARSPLDGPVDDAARLALDIDDLERVIDHRGGGPAHVIGSSSGAIVGLFALARDPRRIRTLVAHEPPLVTLLPDGADWLAVFDDVHATYLASGISAALTRFALAVGMRLAREAPPAAQVPAHVARLLSRMPDNQRFWLEHELRQYPRLVPDVAALRAAADRLVFGVGRDSRGTMLERPARALAAQLDAPVIELVGGHIGYATHAAEFAAEISELLARRT